MKSILRHLATSICLCLAVIGTGPVPARATVNSSFNKTTVLGNGSSTQFTFPFIGVAAADIEVIYTDASGNETVLTQGSGATQYQIVLNAPVPGAIWGLGGTVTYNPSGTPIPNGTTLTIFRTLPLTQAISLQRVNSLTTLGTGAETGLDTITMQLQQTAEQFGRSLVAPIVDPSTINLTLPPAAQRANTGLAFDSQGNVIAGTTPATGLISSAMQPVVNASTLAQGRTAFGLGSASVLSQNCGLGSVSGPNNLDVNAPITQVATNQTVTSAFCQNIFAATGPISFTLPRANTLWNGFGFWIHVVGGDVVTLVPNASDTIEGLSSGATAPIQIGQWAWIVTDAASSGTWRVQSSFELNSNITWSPALGGTGGVQSIGLFMTPTLGSGRTNGSFLTPYNLIWGQSAPVPAGTLGSLDGYECNMNTNQNFADASAALGNHCFGATIQLHGGVQTQGTAITATMDTVPGVYFAHDVNLTNNVVGGQMTGMFIGSTGTQPASYALQLSGMFGHGINLSLNDIIGASYVNFYSGTLVANLGHCGTAISAGTLSLVTDSSISTWGATAVGGGTATVLVYCNGVNWTIAAK